MQESQHGAPGLAEHDVRLLHGELSQQRVQFPQEEGGGPEGGGGGGEVVGFAVAQLVVVDNRTAVCRTGGRMECACN